MGHKFHLGQTVTYRPPREVYASQGAYIVTAKLPERDGTFEYRIRGVNESHERAVRESELAPFIAETNTRAAPEAKRPRRK
jgi:hypothetical protein